MNVIMIMIDSLRADFVGANGNDWIKTPNLDRFIGGSVQFRNAYAESLPTIQVRRAMFTGRRCFPFNDWEYDPDLPNPGWVPVPKEHEILSETLLKQGYMTAQVTDTFHMFRPGMNFHRGFEEWHWIRGQECDRYHVGDAIGLDKEQWKKHVTPKMDMKSRKVHELKMYLRSVSDRKCEEDYFPAQVFRRATRWLEENYQRDKFFLYIDSFDPHEPWDPPRYYRDMYNPGYTGVEPYNPQYVEDFHTVCTEEELNHMRALYAGEVTMVDSWLGHFLNKVKLLGLDKDTMIVIMSDHGHQLGDNNFLGKHKAGLHPCLMDLVMAVQMPAMDQPKKLDQLVYNFDLYPTLFDALGIQVPEWAEGKSLLPLIKGEKTEHRDYLTCTYRNYAWAKTEDYTFFCCTDQSGKQLYDNHADPLQTNNLADEHPEVCEKMWALLMEDAGGEIKYHDLPVISAIIPP